MLARLFNFLKKLLFGSSEPAHSPPIQLPFPPVGAGVVPKVNFGQVRNATKDEALMVNEAVELLNKALSTPLFKGLVLEAKFTETGGLTSEQVYQKLAGSKLVANVEMFTGNFRQNHIWHTVGLDIGDGFVYANRYFVKDKKTLASLMLHEMCHGLGFSHNGYKPTSVPYTCNRIIEEVMDGF